MHAESSSRMHFNPTWISIILCAIACGSILIYGGRILEKIDTFSAQIPILDSRITKIEAKQSIICSAGCKGLNDLTYDF